MPKDLEGTFYILSQWIQARTWGGHEVTCSKFPKCSADGLYDIADRSKIECTCIKGVLDAGYKQISQMYRLPDYAGQLMSLQAKVITLEYEVARLEHERSRDDQAKHDMQ